MTPYIPRTFHHDGLWTVKDLTFKAYQITLTRQPPISARTLANAKQYIALTLPAMRDLEGGDHKLGYVIVHAGQACTWLLTHWWAHNDIAMSMLASAPTGKNRFKSEDHRRFHACVWEHVVIHHERTAWVETMMAERPTPSRYLRHILPNGQY